MQFRSLMSGAVIALGALLGGSAAGSAGPAALSPVTGWAAQAVGGLPVLTPVVDGGGGRHGPGAGPSGGTPRFDGGKLKHDGKGADHRNSPSFKHRPAFRRGPGDRREFGGDHSRWRHHRHKRYWGNYWGGYSPYYGSGYYPYFGWDDYDYGPGSSGSNACYAHCRYYHSPHFCRRFWSDFCD